jgi:hypothetical protein
MCSETTDSPEPGSAGQGRPLALVRLLLHKEKLSFVSIIYTLLRSSFIGALHTRVVGSCMVRYGWGTGPQQKAEKFGQDEQAGKDACRA